MIIQSEKYNLRQATEKMVYTGHIPGNNPIFFCLRQGIDRSWLKRFD
jgi:hypothetical protein